MHIISVTHFPLFCSTYARKCLILPAECSPQKSLKFCSKFCRQNLSKPTPGKGRHTKKKKKRQEIDANFPSTSDIFLCNSLLHSSCHYFTKVWWLLINWNLLFNYNLLFDYITFTITRVHNLLIIYNYLSITITREQKWVHTQTENGKAKEKEKR